MVLVISKVLFHFSKNFPKKKKVNAKTSVMMDTPFQLVIRISLARNAPKIVDCVWAHSTIAQHVKPLVEPSLATRTIPVISSAHPW